MGSWPHIIIGIPHAPLGHLPGVQSSGDQRVSEGVALGRNPDALVVKEKMGTLNMRFSNIAQLTSGSILPGSFLSHDVISLLPFYPVPSRGGRCDYKKDIAFTVMALL